MYSARAAPRDEQRSSGCARPPSSQAATRADTKLDVRTGARRREGTGGACSRHRCPLAGAEPIEPNTATALVVTLWERLESVEAEVPDRSLSKSLAALHSALAQDPHRPAVVRSKLLRARVALGRRRLHGRARAAGPLLPSLYDARLAEFHGLDLDWQRLPGEPHDGNRLLTPTGPRWLDLESCCIGPLERDLAFQSAEVSAAFPEADGDLLRRPSRVNSARVATWCWGQARFPEMRRHGELHLHVLRGEAGRP